MLQRIDELGIELVPDLVALASEVDVLTLHVPINGETRGMVGAEVLDALQPGILLNTSRADVVDSAALLARLDSGVLAAGLDEELLERLAAPIGLDLGAVGPEETALSIMAEVVAVRNGRVGGRLRDKQGGRIHEITGSHA